MPAPPAPPTATAPAVVATTVTGAEPAVDPHAASGTDTAPAAPLGDQTVVTAEQIVFNDQKPVSRPSLLAVGAVGASVAADGTTLFIVHSGRGARLVSERHRVGVPIKVGYVTSSAWSPGYQHLAVATERGAITVVSVPDGKVVATATGGVDPHFISPTLLTYRSGCHAWRLDLTTGKSFAHGKKACGRVLHVDKAGEHWLVATRGRYRFGVYLTYREIRQVALKTGRERVVLKGTDENPFVVPVAAPDGKRICFLRRDPAFGVYCAQVPSGRITEVFPRDGLRPLTFDDSGQRLLFTVGDNDHALRTVYVMDFKRGKRIELLEAKREWWRFLPGGNRIVGHGGGNSALVFDLQGRWKLEIGGGPATEWEGMTTIPGNPNEVILGRERGATRDLYRIRLPQSAPPATP